MKTAYLTSIRAASCYPAFRAFVTVGAVIGYIVAGIAGIAGLASGQGAGVLAGAVAAAVIAALTKIVQEVSLMVADIADAAIDAGSRGAFTDAGASQSNRTPRVNEPTFSDWAVEEDFMEAVRKGDVASVRRVLSNHPISANGTNKNGRGWLQLATITGSIQSAKILLEYGASPEHKDSIGRSAFEEAVAKGDEAFISLFEDAIKKR